MRIALALTASLAVLGLAACKERPLPPPVKAPETTAAAATCVPAAPACPTTPAATPAKPIHRTGVGVGSHPVRTAPVRYAHRSTTRGADYSGYSDRDAYRPAPRTYARVYTDDRYGDTYYESGATAGYPRMSPPPPPPRVYTERREVYVDGYGQEDRYGAPPAYRPAPPRQVYRREVQPVYPPAPYMAPPRPAPREVYRREEYRQDYRQGGQRDGGYREAYREERYYPEPVRPVPVHPAYPQRGSAYSYSEERGYSENYSQQGYGQGEAYGYHQRPQPPHEASAYTTAGRNKAGFLTWAGKRD